MAILASNRKPNSLSTLFQSIYTNLLAFTTDQDNLVVFAFVAIFVLISFFALHKHEVLSASAIKNTLATLSMLVFNVTTAPIVYLAAKYCREIYASLHLPHVATTFWQGIPWLLVAIIGVATKDFADYCSHRAMHTKWIWPIHAVHHSDTHVNGLTLYRIHLLEILFMQVTYIVLLSWLGIPELLIATAYVIGSLHSAYVHFELDVDHGPLNWLVASPRFHRWHHADTPAAFGKNLANHMPLLDMMFGTYYNPGPCREKMGALSDDIPDHNGFKLLLLPFVLWQERIASAISKTYARLAQTRTQS